MVVKQGRVIRLQNRDAVTATLLVPEKPARPVRFYRQADGSALALVPVPVLAPVGPAELVVADVQGQPLLRRRVQIVDGGYRYQNIRATPGMKAIQPDPDEYETMRKLERYETEQRYWQEPLVLPARQCQSSPFGNKRQHNGVLTGSIHRGVDLRAPVGTPVRAIAGGVVRVARKFSLQGGTIGIDHGQGVTSNYIHLSKLLRQEGESVAQGDIVGEVGTTGFSTGPHLHWGMTVNGEAIDPTSFGLLATPCSEQAKARGKGKGKAKSSVRRARRAKR